MNVLATVRKIVMFWDAVIPDAIWNYCLHTIIADAATAATLRQENTMKRVFLTSHLELLIQTWSLDDLLAADLFIA